MAVHYSPKHFLRQVPNSLLKTLFERRGELSGVRWEELEEMDVDPIFDSWQLLPESNRSDIERWFREISDIATPEGLQTLIEEGQFHRIDFAAEFERMKGIHEKVFWIFLNHERVFTSAGRLNRADHLNGRYWRRRTGLPVKNPDLTHPTRQLLGEAISQYYREHQGRGEHCNVEVFLRRGAIHYFFAYPADYADTVIIYDGSGSLERQLQKAAFEVIFAYNEAAGTLDLYVEGDKNIRRAMEEIFCRLVLKEALPDDESAENPFELDGLRNRNFDFPTNPEDMIQEVRVKSLRLSVVGPGLGRISFESDDRTRRGNIYDLMDKSLSQRMNLGALKVIQARIQVVFATSGRSKSVSFQLSHPDGCNLKDKPEHLKIKEYLKRWGIARE